MSRANGESAQLTQGKLTVIEAERNRPLASKVMSLRATLSRLGDSPSLGRLISVARTLDGSSEDRMRVTFAFLRNFTVEPGGPAALKVAAARAGMSATIYLGDFDNAEEQAFDSQSGLYAAEPDVIVVALRLQAIAPRLVLEFTAIDADETRKIGLAALQRVTSLVAAIRERSNATIVVHNFEQPAAPAYGFLDAKLAFGQRRTINMLNQELATLIGSISSAYIIDVELHMANIGTEHALDQRYWHLARSPYTLGMHERLANDYVTVAAALKGKTKKCLVLDCDNTLWGGVIGEDGLAGIALGATNPGSAFVELHSAILDFYRRGVLLAIASKNNEGDVLEVLGTHPNSLLKPQHFVAKRINWQNKASNLREIAAELDIGIESLVFVDDSAFECQLIRETVPEVEVVELPRDPSRYASVIRGLRYFDGLTLTDEDRRRSETYHAKASREALRISTKSIEDYMESLEMVLTVGHPSCFTIPRIAQLTQKTNQFNMTTRRYSEADISMIARKPDWQIYYAELSDRFDHAGIIAVAALRFERDEAIVDTFLMSCRVIGRGVEQAFLSVIIEECKVRGVNQIIGEYIPTAKNSLARPFFANAGFQEKQPDRWVCDLNAAVVKTPRWFKDVLLDATVPA